MHERQQRARELATSPTDITGLDEITVGGLPPRRPTRICGSAGGGQAVFGMACLVRGVQCGEAGGVTTLVTAGRGEDQGNYCGSSVLVSEMAGTGRAAKRSEEPAGTGSGP